MPSLLIRTGVAEIDVLDDRRDRTFASARHRFLSELYPDEYPLIGRFAQ